MSGLVISRQQMVDCMAERYNAKISEAPFRNWRRVNTAVVHQTDSLVDADEINFHMIEICLDGLHSINVRGELEGAERQQLQLRPGMTSYVQDRSPLYQELYGHVTLQQVCIDKSIFRDASAAFGQGDPGLRNTLGFQGVFEGRLKQLCQALLDEARTGAAGSDLFADLIAQQMALVLLRRQYGNERSREIGVLSAAETDRVLDYLENHLDDPGGMDVLARQLDMDVFRFVRAFKATTGEAPHQFLIGRRLTRAKELLAHGCETLADIAYATGFSSQSHMTATFTKHVGMPPGKYRREVRR